MSEPVRYYVPEGDDVLIPDTGQDFAGYSYVLVYRASDYDTQAARCHELEAQLENDITELMLA